MIQNYPTDRLSKFIEEREQHITHYYNLLHESILSESYDDDFDTLEKANVIYNQIVDRIENIIPKNRSLDFGSIEGIPIKLQMNRTLSNFATNESCTVIFVPLMDKMGNVPISTKNYIEMLLHYTILSIKNKKNSVIHELVHIIDHHKHKKSPKAEYTIQNKNNPSKEELDRYYNSATEYNAHFIQALDEIRDYFEIPANYRTLNDYVQKTKENNFSEAFNIVKDKIKSLYINKISTAMRKKFLIRLYKDAISIRFNNMMSQNKEKDDAMRNKYRVKPKIED